MKIAKLIRWNIETAAREFGINPRTMSARLTAAAIQPAEDGFYSTQEIASAVFSDYEQERTRLTKAQADQAEHDLAANKKEVLPIEIAFQAASNVICAMLRILELSEKLTAEEKDDLRKQAMSFSQKNMIEEMKFESGE